MHIKEIVLDGFKSYATRTVVSGFDPKFNAITGLNGSGKSNILDGICFVLGITQLNQVRVNNLQGLVYKNGQAGVTKASVSIVFDNSDQSQSPVGYEQYNEITVTRQVVIGGRNKYLINGHTAQVSQVQNLFHSVQLNVNNPHFLIMQGRITKVLNMKPPEILGLIEEAAGTRMYETKKHAAQKKMEQKQVKVDEIETLLAEEITPKLEKFRAQKQAYLKWAANNTEAERLKRICVAYEYTQKAEILQASEEEVDGLRGNIQKSKDLREEIVQGKCDLDAKKKHLQQRRAQEMGGEFKELSEKEEKLSQRLVKENTIFKNQQAAFDKEKENFAAIQQSQVDIQNTIDQLKAKCQTIEDEFEQQTQVVKGCEARLETAQRNVQAASAGISAEDSENGATGTLQEQLIEAQKAVQHANTTIKQMEMKKKHLVKELQKSEKQVEKMKTSNTKMDQELVQKRAEADKLQGELEKLDFDETKIKELKQKLAANERELESVKEVVEAMWTNLAQFDFQFASPSKGFDRSKVKGLVARLVNVKDISTATALEVVAGGKLYQVVVDRVDTGKQLLQKGKLKRRVTIIPLDKVSSRTVPSDRVAKASAIAKSMGGEANLALSLVGYDQEIESAMKYVFGTTLVCDSLEVARSVTFDKEVRVRSVTLEGDAFDPQGTLSGGSRPNRGSVLVQLQKLAKQQERMQELEQSILNIRKELAANEKTETAFTALKRNVELALHQVTLLENRLKNTEYFQICAQHEDMKANLEEVETTIQTSNDEISAAHEKKDLLEHELKNMDARRERLTKEAEDALAAAKKSLAAELKKKHNKQQELELTKSELDERVAESAALKETETDLAASLEKTKIDLEKLEAIVAESLQAYREAEDALKSKRETLAECEQELSDIAAEETKVEKLLQRCELDIKKMEGKLNRLTKDRSSTVKQVEHLVTTHPWIESAKQFFGKPHTDYDFEARDPVEAKKTLAKLQETQNQLSSKINQKVTGMIEKAEKEYDDLIKKRQIIEKDRSTIERVIHGLDKKKNEALKTTWAKVNHDFGSIFSTLLRGTQAKLEPPEGCTVLDGLEVRVAFGDTWKESLTELSGGQRSLLALSLILALLLFKPAPMYILDEVDAALDLSHTQNIGQMLRTHFAHSQFIVVSLKEGMFNNASVIFRTKFVDGVSTVRRTVPANKRIANDENLANDANHGKTTSDEGIKKKSKKRTSTGPRKSVR